MSRVAALPELIGTSAAMMALRHDIDRLLRRPSGSQRFPPVLIRGDTGTGKGLVARTLHQRGPRASGPFVDVNCAAIPENLLESEMFGYERGAFTDARRPKPGLLQTANGGTIFLDEVGLLPEALQAKLLKALEDRSVRRLGSTRDEPVDVWILTATNEDLQAAIRQRRFREDLYHRLAVLTLTLPPLTERGDDVLVLAEHFLERACADYGLPGKALSADARARMKTYRWPGNVRELGNVIERAVLLASGADITAATLALKDEPDTLTPSSAADASPAVMRDRTLQVLTDTGWNITRTANALGITRNTLRARMERYGLRPQRPEASAATSSPPAAGSSEPVSVAPIERVPTARPAEIARPARPPSQRWETRRITVLRASIVPVGDDVPPAEVSPLLDLLIDKAETFGGKVDGIAHDGLLAAFGLEPVEDAASRAGNAAVAMLRAIDHAHRYDRVGAVVRVALYVAYSSVRTVGANVDIDMASRRSLWATADDLLVRAAPNTIAVDETAAPFFKRRFEVVDVGATYRLIGPQKRAQGQDGFVGRRHEIELLRGRFDSTLSGRGQVVGIGGEPGIGKSRLVSEFLHAVDAERISVLEASCHSYGTAVPYLPVLELIRAQLGIVDADTPEAVVDKVASALSPLGLGTLQSTAALLQLLGIKDADGGTEPATPETAKLRIFETLRHMVLRASRQRPHILVIEDLHWIDRTSEEFLGSLVDGITAAPVLVVVTFRSGYRPPWADRSYATQIALQPLTRDESADLVRGVAGPRHLGPSLLAAVVGRGEGNPFFLEELALAAADRGDALAHRGVPDTIQEIVLARMARLPQPARRLLQEASVIGRMVSPEMLAAIRSGAEPIDDLVRDLAHVEFLYPDASGEELVYVFKHALTREVAYDALPAADRAVLHAMAARHLEHVYADRLHEACDRIAYHYAHTADDAKAVHYLRLSAARSASAYAHTEAIEALRQARTRAERGGRDADIVELVLLEAHSLHVLGRFQDTLDLLRAHEGRLDRLREPAQCGPYYFWMARTASVLGDAETTGPNIRRAIECARACSDDATLGKAYFMLAYEDYWSGRPAQGVTHGREAVAMLERTDERWWEGMANWIVALNSIPLGDFQAGREATDQARAIGQAIGDFRLQNYADWTRGWSDAVRGDVASALEACRRARERSQDPVNGAYAVGQLGCAFLEGGDSEQAIPLIESAIREFASFNVRQTPARFRVSLSEAYLAAGQVDEAERIGKEALALGESVGFQYAVGLAHRALGRVANARGDHVTARASYERSVAVFRAMQAPFEEARTSIFLAEALAGAAAVTDAIVLLDRATETFDKVGAPAHAERARRLSALLR